MQFTVEASTSDPRTREGYARDNLADFDYCPDRSSANEKARYFHRRGLWVEVYHTEYRRAHVRADRSRSALSVLTSYEGFSRRVSP
jgi:hypothetical protein